ncbi:MAG: hypothetical protein ABI273_22660 [Lacunisphaera sp.]
MRVLILSLVFVIVPPAWAAPLSRAMDQPGDFIVIDERGQIQLVGRLEMDPTLFFRAYADGRRERGRAFFVIGQYREGKIVDASKGVVEYTISDDQIVFSFNPGVQDAGLTFLIHFDPSKEISVGDASEGNVAGPRSVGAAHVRFRKQELKSTSYNEGVGKISSHGNHR